MIWIPIDQSKPPKEGKYLVRTLSSHMKTIHRLEARFNGNSFDVTNQIVTHWLKED